MIQVLNYKGEKYDLGENIKVYVKMAICSLPHTVS